MPISISTNKDLISIPKSYSNNNDGSKREDDSKMRGESKANSKLYPGYSRYVDPGGNCNGVIHRSNNHDSSNDFSSNTKTISSSINQSTPKLPKEKREEIWWEHYTDGMMFICTKETYDECRELKLLGLPGSHLRLVKGLRAQTSALFLFNVSDRYCHGVFEAVSPGQKNIVPNAWARNQEFNRSRFPAQVQFKIAFEFEPLPESAFRHLFTDANRIVKLDEYKVKELITIFRDNQVKGQSKSNGISNNNSNDNNTFIATNSNRPKVNLYKTPPSIPLFQPPIPAQNMWKLGQEDMMVKTISEKNNKDHTTDHMTPCWPIANSTPLRSQPSDPEIWNTHPPQKSSQLPLAPHFAQYPGQFLPHFPSQFPHQIPSQLSPIHSQFASPLSSQFASQLPPQPQFPSQIPSQSYSPVTLQTLPHHPSQPSQPPQPPRLPLTPLPSQKPSMAKVQNMAIGENEQFDQMNNRQLNSRFVRNNIGNDGVKDHNDMLNQQIHVDRQLDVVDQMSVQQVNSEQFQLHRHQQLETTDPKHDVSSQSPSCYPPGLSHSKLSPESATNYSPIHDDRGGRYNVDHREQQLERTTSMTESLTLEPKNLTDHYHKKSPRALQNAIPFSQADSSNHNSNSMAQTEQPHHNQSAENSLKDKTKVPPYWNTDTGWNSNWEQYDADKSVWNNGQIGNGTDWSPAVSKGGSTVPGSKQSVFHDNQETWKQDLSTGNSSSFSQQKHGIDNNSYTRNSNKNRVLTGNEDQENNIGLKPVSSLVQHSQPLAHLDTNSPTSISLTRADRLSPFSTSTITSPKKTLARSSNATSYSNDPNLSRANSTHEVWASGTQVPVSASTPTKSHSNTSSAPPTDPNNKKSYKSYGTNFLNQSIWSGDLSLWVNSPSNKDERSRGSIGVSDSDFSCSPAKRQT